MSLKANRLTWITAGFGYSFFNSELRDHSHPVGFDEFSGDLKDLLQPLLFQPGEGWQYGECTLAQRLLCSTPTDFLYLCPGVNIDFAGLALERITGLSLNEYCHKNIFEPLNLRNICKTFIRDEELMGANHVTQLCSQMQK